jgi:hypothetical protein
MKDADFSFAQEHIIYQLLNTPNKGYPYPHSYIENFFPNSFYSQIQSFMLEEEDLKPICSTGWVRKGVFPERSVMQLPSDEINALGTNQKIFWSKMSELLNSIELQSALLHKFQPLVDHRLGENLGTDTTFNPEVIFLQDKGGFTIQPHPDVNQNVVVLLIYLPKTDENFESGTSLYIPKDRSYRCEKGLHHQFSDFDRIHTFEYRPNTAICFLKTSASFHGVEKIPKTDSPRNLIQVCIEHDPVTKPL